LKKKFWDIFSNIVHGSDSETAAKREINLWFRPEEVTNWPHTAEKWIYE
jgi:nucleoside-diphosphate kinase